MKLVMVFCVCALAGGRGEANDQAALADAVNCLKELELPRFAVASVVPKGGTVKATVTLKDDGQPASVKVDASDWHLGAEVEHHLREAAQYRAGCGGQEVRLEFTFRVEGSPVSSPFAKVQFLPPNRFVIITQPGQSTPDFVPLNKKDSRKRGPAK